MSKRITNLTSISLSNNKQTLPKDITKHIHYSGLCPTPIQTHSESSINIFNDTPKKLKQMFKEINRVDSGWGVFDEKTGEYVGGVDYE